MSKRRPRALWVAVGILLFVVMPTVVQVLRDADEESASPPFVASPFDACDQFWDTIVRGARERMDDTRLQPLLRALADGTERVDRLQASNIRDVASGESAAEVSDSTAVVLRRCTLVHAWPPPTEAEVQEVLDLSRDF